MTAAEHSDLINKVRAKAQSADIQILMTQGEMADVFAACCIAAEKALGITAYDEQITAAAELVGGNIAEMKTGEGKTLSAVFAACYKAVQGRNVHILTFNDYLAKRDYKWMREVYGLCGISVAYISQKSTPDQRRSAYAAQVTYVTARECGFDFLRDFVAQSKEECVHSGFDCAIVDEADSILIDEARVPLVIAGQTAVTPDKEIPVIYEAAKTLDDTCYEINEEYGTIYLTENGAVRCEELLTGGTSLYDEENNVILTKLTDCLKACFMLKRDVDYIVRDGNIRIIDEFTGRAAENRRYPGCLQSAVEYKEGINCTTRGVVMGIVPLQFFARQYRELCGMTGTAKSSEEEFYELYDLKVSQISTHTPCRRTDHPTEIYLTAEAKNTAIIERIISANAKNQPVLIGTPSIEESERLASQLSQIGIETVVLSAKNDELEAEIIKNAGRPGAVTISANMSGRGVDIKLGGADGAEAAEAQAAGGLLIIGTFLSESIRGDDQLRGRSGRQGDIGESRFYVSLEDEIMTKYDIKSLIPKRHYPTVETGRPITDKYVVREAERIQRIAQGDTLDLRKRLLKFTMIGEKHRETVFGRKKAFLSGETKVSVWENEFPDLYEQAVIKFGAEKTAEVQKKLILSVINEYWSDYLDYTSYLRDGIHLTRIGGKNPADEYNIACEEFFSGMEEQVISAMGEQLEILVRLDSADDLIIKNPTALWTYTLNESGEELLKKSFIQTALDDELSEEEYDEYYGGENRGEPEEKGFFARLFGRK